MPKMMSIDNTVVMATSVDSNMTEGTRCWLDYKKKTRINSRLALLIVLKFKN